LGEQLEADRLEDIGRILGARAVPPGDRVYERLVLVDQRRPRRLAAREACAHEPFIAPPAVRITNVTRSRRGRLIRARHETTFHAKTTRRRSTAYGDRGARAGNCRATCWRPPARSGWRERSSGDSRRPAVGRGHTAVFVSRC